MAFDAALTAWATLALGILALITAIVAGGAWIVQARQLRELRQVNEKQLPVLEGQQAELEASRQVRERDEQERRERFVTQVFCWQEIGPDRRLTQPQIAAGAKPSMVSSTYIRNTGPVPVYELGFGWWIGDRLDTFVNRVTPLMPPGVEIREGESAEGWHQAIPPGTDTITAALFIRDAAGQRWRLQPGGRHEPFDDAMLPPGTWKTT
jgi:hypothetical protein